MEDKSNLITYEKLEYLEIYDSQGQYVGEVEELLIDPAKGGIAYAIISLDDECGKEEKLHVVPWNTFKYDQDKNELQLSIAKKTIEDSQSFTEHRYPDFSKISSFVNY